MAKKDNYRIKVKNGRNLIEVEGDKAFVNDVFQEIKKIFPKVPPSHSPRKRGPKPKPRPSIDLKTVEVPELVSKVQGKNQTMKVLVSGFCINKKLRKREFRSKEMTSFMKDVGLDVPNNLTYYFRKLKDDGLFILGRKQGRFKISDEGIRKIESTL